ncbi:MAG TPA: GNAT family N-acetyltransferase [Ignavibacteria bacterium]|nr:GNAT family N-acetyltransferase [Ignavibacteria bacterium]
MLRKYEVRDKEKFAELFTDTDVIKFMGGQHCETKEVAYRLFEKGFEIYNGLFPDRHFDIWAIELGGKMIGHFEMKQTNNTIGDELEVVYLLDKSCWSQGLMQEILIEVNKYASGLGKQLIATINLENEKTINALRKLKIEKEGWMEDDDGKVYKIWLEKAGSLQLVVSS